MGLRGSPQFTHVGLDDYSIVHANLNGSNRTNRNRFIPFRGMFADPNWRAIGGNEAGAHRDGIKCRVVKLPLIRRSGSHYLQTADDTAPEVLAYIQSARDRVRSDFDRLRAPKDLQL
jgi:pyruvate/2-oxoglutarate dehydrogenase complex dihydrolipoamide dehydrogenase (E3) component